MSDKPKTPIHSKKMQHLHNTALNNPHTAITLTEGIDKYIQDLEMRHYSRHTVYGYHKRLQLFLAWAEERALSLAACLTEDHLDRYRRYLHFATYGGKRLQATTQKGHLMVIKQVFFWLTEHRWIATNPALKLSLPKIPYRLTHRLLTQEEIPRFIAAIDLESATGLRDRSIIETLYSTGIRRAELINLTTDDIDAANGMILVREGKGQKDRCIPIGERALGWIDRYVSEWRMQRPRATHSKALYLSEKGYRLREADIGQKIRAYKATANINKPGGCHLFRHAMATHMLDNGADIRHIQEMLGHESLSSTQIYTKVSKQALKEVHSKTHPAAKEEES
jgi:integrase/recombinase XerD